MVGVITPENKRTIDQIRRDREMAEALMKGGLDFSPVAHPLQGLARVAQAAAGAYRGYRADQADAANALASQQAIAGLLAGIGGGGSTMPGGGFPAAPGASVPSTGGVPDTATDYSGITPASSVSAPEGIRDGILSTAQSLGIDPVDLATAISYETAGTFDPMKRGPTTQWGQHRGLIQFGEPQARQHGVNWDDPIGSQLGPNGAVASYLRKAGVKPGMGLLDVYSAINAGGVGLYNRSDANNGGAPGTVRDKVEKQMAGHRAKALALMGSAAQPTAGQAIDAIAPIAAAQGDPLASEIGVPAPAAPLSEQERAVRREQLAPIVQQAGAPYTPAPTPLTGATPPMTPMPVPVADDEAAVLAYEQQMAQQDPATWAGVPSTPEIPVMVAEDEAGIQALEAQMAGQGDPAFAAPVDPMATGAAPMPFAAQPAQGTPPMSPELQVAQALTALPVNESLPLMGGYSPPPAPPAAPSGINPLVAQSLSNPNASAQERQIAGVLLQQQMAEMQAARQAQAQAAAAAQAQAQRYQAANQAGIDPNFARDDTLWQESVKDRFRDRGTDTQRNLEWRAQQAGLQPGTPEYQKFMLEGGDKGISVNVDTGTIPPGYQAVRDQSGRVVRYEAIPGGPADTSGKEAAALENQSVTGDVILTAAKRARDIAKTSGRLATGFGGQLLANIGESDAAELRRQVDVLKSNAKIENLTAMRAASPTGGALGAVSDKENEMLAAKTGALDPNAKPEVFQAALDDYERTLLRIIHGNKVGDAIFEQTREAEGGDWQDVGGVKIRKKQ